MKDIPRIGAEYVIPRSELRNWDHPRCRGCGSLLKLSPLQGEGLAWNQLGFCVQGMHEGYGHGHRLDYCTACLAPVWKLILEITGTDDHLLDS